MRIDVPRVLWGTVLALLLALVLEWAWPVGNEAGATVSPARLAVQARAPALAARDTSAWVNAVLARPLFSQTRRPPRITVHQPGVLAVGQARLAGIMITRTGKRAIFAPDGGGKQLVLPEGAAVNESTIRRILPDRVMLASGAVLLPSYDKVRVSGGPTAFQPFTPGFGNNGSPPGFNPGFPNPGFPAPGLPGGFPNGAFQNPAFQNQQPPGEENGAANQGPLILRGNANPQRRE